jgi:hypothetical protein
MRIGRGGLTLAIVYPSLAFPRPPRRLGPDGMDMSRAWGAVSDQGSASTRLRRRRLWLAVASCLLVASAAPPAAGAEQAPPKPPPPPPLVGHASLTLSTDRSLPRVGDRLHLTATLTPAGAEAVTGARVTVALPQGLDLLSADPVSASLATWSVPTLAAGQTETLTLLVRAVAPGAQTASVQLQDGTRASATVTPYRSHASRTRHARPLRSRNG